MPLNNMKLAVDVGLQLGGFEQLVNLAKSLEALHDMAALVTSSFTKMGDAFHQASMKIASDTTKAAAEIERLTQITGTTASAGIASTAATMRERIGAPPPPEEFAMTGVPAFLQRQRNGMPASEQERSRSFNMPSGNFGVMGSIGSSLLMGAGITAAFEVSNLVRRSVQAVGDLDERMASLRISGYSPEQIADLRKTATEAYVPGATVAEKISGAQQLGNIVGPQNVTGEMMKDVQLATNAIMLATGRQDRGEVMQQFIRIAQSRGPLNADTLLKTLQDIELLGKDANLESIKNSAQQGQTFSRGLDINNNPQLRALNNTFIERFGGRGGGYLNQLLTEFYSNIGKLSAGHGGNRLQQLLMSQGLFDMSHISAYPALTARGDIHPSLQVSGPALKGVQDQKNVGEVFGVILKAMETDFVRHFGRMPTELERVQQYSKFLPPEEARSLATMTADDFINEYKQQVARQKLVPQTWEEEAKKSENFRQSLRNVGAEFDSLVSTFGDVGGLTSDLNSFATGIHNTSVFLSHHQGVSNGIVDLGESLGVFFGILGAAKGIRWFSGLFAGARAALVAEEAAAVGAASFTGLSAAIGLTVPEIAAFIAALYGLSKLAIPGIKQSIEQHDKYAKEHPDETWVDPISGLAVPGLKNKDQMPNVARQKEMEAEREHHQKAMQSTISHIEQERNYQPPVVTPTAPAHAAAPPHAMEHRPQGYVPAPVPIVQELARQTVNRGRPFPGLAAPIAPPMAPSIRAPQGARTPLGLTAPPIAPGLSMSSIPPSQGAQQSISMPGVLSTNTIQSQTLIVQSLSIAGQGGAAGQRSFSPSGAPSGSTWHGMQQPIHPSSNSNFNRFMSGVPTLGGTSGIPGMPGHAGPVGTPHGMPGLAPHAGGQPGVPHGAAPNAGTPINMAGIKAAPFSGTHNQFFQSVQKDIYKAAIAHGMSPLEAKTIAHIGASQASLETGYGKHMVGNNLFGIKAAGGVGQGVVNASTREVIGGKSVTQNANFAAFNSQEAAANGYIEFLMKYPRYQPILTAASQGNEAAAIGALGASGYATDPRYAQGVGSIAQSYEAMKPPDIQGPQPTEQQADVPAGQLHLTIHSQHMLDGEAIADGVAHHFLAGGPTASASATAYDSKAMPLAPGVSIPRW